MSVVIVKLTVCRLSGLDCNLWDSAKCHLPYCRPHIENIDYDSEAGLRFIADPADSVVSPPVLSSAVSGRAIARYFWHPKVVMVERLLATTKEVWSAISSPKAALLLSLCCHDFAVCLHVMGSHVWGQRPATFFPCSEIRLLSCHGGCCPGGDKELSGCRCIEAPTDSR